MARPFVLFGPDHRLVLSLALSGIVALWAGRRTLRAHQHRGFRRAWAAALVLNEVSAWIWAWAHGQPRVPLQLCDLAVFLTAWALWGSRWPVIGELAYFWQLAGGVQAVLTPDLSWGFPDYWCVKFFLTHCGALLGVVYLAVIGEVAPRAGAVWRVWGLTNLYALAVGLINWGWGTNYGYLAHKPAHPSLLDHFGPWPWYIAVLEVTALGSFALYNLPFSLGATRRQHDT